MTKERKQEIIETYRRDDSDTGSFPLSYLFASGGQKYTVF